MGIKEIKLSIEKDNEEKACEKIAFEIEECDFEKIKKSTGLKIIEDESAEFQLTECQDNYVGTLTVIDKKIVSDKLFFEKCKRCKNLKNAKDILKSCEKDVKKYKKNIKGEF